MAILVCGGAGYIGSHTVKELVDTYEVVVLDNLTTGFESLIDERATFVKGDLGDGAVLDRIFTDHAIDAGVVEHAFVPPHAAVADEERRRQAARHERRDVRPLVR